MNPPINADQQLTQWLFTLAHERPVSLLDLIPNLTPRSPTANEWRGPCPFCQGGTNRFAIFPVQEPRFGGRFYCRTCERTGNMIHFLRTFLGWDFYLARDLFTFQNAGLVSSPPLRLPEPDPKALAPTPADYQQLLSEWASCQERLQETATTEDPDVYTDDDRAAAVKTLLDLDSQRENLLRRQAQTDLAGKPPMFSTPEERAEFIRLTNEYKELLPEIETAQIAYRALTRRPDLYTEEQRYWIDRVARLYTHHDWLAYILDTEPATQG